MITADNAGCWIDGHWGHYSGARLIFIAIEAGWDDRDANYLAELYFATQGESEDSEPEHFYDLVDEAENYLNTLAPQGYSFGWYDGEFFLWNNEDWEEVYE